MRVQTTFVEPSRTASSPAPKDDVSTHTTGGAPVDGGRGATVPYLIHGPIETMNDIQSVTVVIMFCILLTISSLAVGGAGGEAPTVQPHQTDDATAHVPQTGSPVGVAPGLFQDIAGQVATEDGEVTVRGRATGVDDVLVTLIDERGQLVSELVSVDEDDSFEEDIALVTPRGRELSEGTIVATVFHTGRDGIVGDGEIRGFRRADLAALDESVRQQIQQQLPNASVSSKSRAQVLELFYDESVNDTGSDDNVLVDAFTYTDGQTTIESVFPRLRTNRSNALNVTVVLQPGADEAGNRTATVELEPRVRIDAVGIRRVPVGETMVVGGLTNRKPEDNTIFVEVVEGPSAEAFELAQTDTWETDGVWTVELDTTGIEPGTYVIEADDGDSSDQVEVEIVPRRNRTTQNATVTTTETTNATSEPTTETPTTETTTQSATAATGTEGATPTPEPTPAGETTTTGPGAGVVVALVALTVVTLQLARRRNR